MGANQSSRGKSNAYGNFWCADQTKSIRACAQTPGCRWAWTHAKDSTGTPYLLTELNREVSFLPSTQKALFAAAVSLSLEHAAKGELLFNAGDYSDERLRGPSVADSEHRVGPVKKMRKTKAVFEISQDGRDWEEKGDSFRYVRLYFSEPPPDVGELVSLRLASKPIGGNDLQDDDARTSQDRYDAWMQQ